MIRRDFKFTQNTDFRYIKKTQKEVLKGILQYFNGFSILDSEDKKISIKSIYSHPERVIAKIFKENTIILPLISIGRGDIENDDSRRKYKSILTHQKYWDNKKKRAIRILSWPPRPVNIIYDINIWTKYREDLDSLLDQIYFRFNPDIEVITTFSNTNKGFLVQESNISELESPDGTDRIIRKVLTLQVETYIQSPKYLYTSTGEIESFNFEYDLSSL